MITQRRFTDPECRYGYLIHGVVNTNASGVGTFTIAGQDLSAKLVGINLTCKDAGTGNGLIAHVVSIVYDSATQLNTVTIQALKTSNTAVLNGIKAALDAIVTGAPADIAALLVLITTAGNSIAALGATGVIAFDGDVEYSCFVSFNDLPADLTVNDTTQQDY